MFSLPSGMPSCHHLFLWPYTCCKIIPITIAYITLWFFFFFFWSKSYWTSHSIFIPRTRIQHLEFGRMYLRLSFLSSQSISLFLPSSSFKVSQPLEVFNLTTSFSVLANELVSLISDLCAYQDCLWNLLDRFPGPIPRISDEVNLLG